MLTTIIAFIVAHQVLSSLAASFLFGLITRAIEKSQSKSIFIQELQRDLPEIAPSVIAWIKSRK